MSVGNPIRKAPSKHDLLDANLQNGSVVIDWRNSRKQWTKSEIYVRGLEKFGKRIRGHGMLNLFGRTVSVQFDIGARNSFLYFVP